MKYWSEGRAAIAAVVTATVVLGATFGFAAFMQRFDSQRRTAPAINSQSPTVALELAGDARQGRRLFVMNCAHCHGDDAHGDEGPDLYDLPKSDARIHQVITAGIKGEMPSFAKKLGEDDIRALTAYLRTLKA
jgi:mono/diheme cytochrome c family protein